MDIVRTLETSFPANYRHVCTYIDENFPYTILGSVQHNSDIEVALNSIMQTYAEIKFNLSGSYRENVGREVPPM